jgi:hypothetical protein
MQLTYNSSRAVAQEDNRESQTPIRPRAASAIQPALIVPPAPWNIIGSLCCYHRNVVHPSPPHFIRLEKPRVCQCCGRSIHWAESQSCEWASGFFDLLAELAEVARGRR